MNMITPDRTVAETRRYPSPGGAMVPEGSRIYAIGDIHGRADLLAQLMRTINAYSDGAPAVERELLIFLGDYVDRGAQSAEVIEMLINGLPERFEPVFLKGNHEALMMQFIEGDGAAFEVWRYNGGMATLASYGVEIDRLCRGRGGHEPCRAALLAQMPRTHLEFFENLRLYAEFGDYLFVHAGIVPGVPLQAQGEEHLIWIRGPFLNYRRDFGGKIVVHGHTPSPTPELLDNRIGIDTGAWKSGRLSAVVLENARCAFLST